jgi:hypothetical protein
VTWKGRRGEGKRKGKEEMRRLHAEKETTVGRKIPQQQVIEWSRS